MTRMEIVKDKILYLDKYNQELSRHANMKVIVAILRLIVDELEKDTHD